METKTREFCARCTMKHLAKAAVIMNEGLLGYPYNLWYTVGNMSEAEDEIVRHLPEEANAIRAARVRFEASFGSGTLAVPDFDKLMMMVAKAAMLPEAM